MDDTGSSTSVLIGRTIVVYKVEKEIGESRWGKIYRAVQASIGRTVALRILSPELAAMMGKVEHFLEESRAEAQLVHPHIVSIYEAGHSDGTFFSAMEFMDGPSLPEYLRHGNVVDEHRLLQTVAGVARVPFAVGIDSYLPSFFGKIHPRWKTPYVSIIVQAVASALVLLLSQINETTRGAYQAVIDITIILYFIPFLYMFAAAVKLAGRPDRTANPHAVLVPGGKAGVWIACTLAFSVTLLSIIVSVFPPGDSSNRKLFLIKVIGTTVLAVAVGLILYFWGAAKKRSETS